MHMAGQVDVGAGGNPSANFIIVGKPAEGMMTEYDN